MSHRPMAALAGLAMAACLVFGIGLRVSAKTPQTAASFRPMGEPGLEGPNLDEPNLRLTPGATIPVSESQVCGAGPEKMAVIPVALQKKVFALYGVSRPQPDAYEVDYLITPELGGATDIRNLWPEPYDDVWNAHVKDQLEERLHSMVCQGRLDLATAQRDISTDWIAAYRKYFHADTPMAENAAAQRRL